MHKLRGTFRGDRHQGAPVAPAAQSRLLYLQEKETAVKSNIARLEAKLEDTTSPVNGYTLREHRHQLAALLHLYAAIGALERAIENAPIPEEPDAFDKFAASRWAGALK